MIRSYKDIPGWFSCNGLYDQVVEEAMTDSLFLEIGCFMGKSSAYLLEQIRKSGKDIMVCLVDTFAPENEECEEILKIDGRGMNKALLWNLRDLGFRTGAHYTTLAGKSQELGRHFYNESLNFIFVDGDPCYEAVKKDIEVYWPKLKKGALMGFPQVDIGLIDFAAGHDLQIEILNSGAIIRK